MVHTPDSSSPPISSDAKALFKVNPVTREVFMSKPTITTQIVPLDGRHICNHCLQRDFAQLEPVLHSTSARHCCGAQSVVVPVRGAKNEVVRCSGYAAKRGGGRG